MLLYVHFTEGECSYKQEGDALLSRARSARGFFTNPVPSTSRAQSARECTALTPKEYVSTSKKVACTNLRFVKKQEGECSHVHFVLVKSTGKVSTSTRVR